MKFISVPGQIFSPNVLQRKINIMNVYYPAEILTWKWFQVVHKFVTIIFLRISLVSIAMNK